MEGTNDSKPVVTEEVAKVKTTTVEGTVKSFDLGRRYGFITQDNVSKEVFVHQEAVLGEGHENLAAGDRVSFEVSEGPKGPRAASVRKL